MLAVFCSPAKEVRREGWREGITKQVGEVVVAEHRQGVGHPGQHHGVPTGHLHCTVNTARYTVVHSTQCVVQCAVHSACYME